MTEGFIFESEAEAQAACKWWQRQLGLQDWRVVTCLIRKRDMKDPSHDGEITWNEHWKEATIFLADGDDINTRKWFPPDHEEILVHELDHLHTWKLPDEYSDVEESALCANTRALVNLRRLAYPEPPWRGDDPVER